MKRYKVIYLDPTVGLEEHFLCFAEDISHAMEQCMDAYPKSKILGVNIDTTFSEETSLIISGNLFDGFNFFGPFSDHESAIEWAEKTVSGEWLVATLHVPE